MSSRNNKLAFLSWLLDHFRHENPSVNYLLKYIATTPSVLNNIEFTEASNYAPRGLYISYLHQSNPSFIYYKDQRPYHLSDQAFHDIRLNQTWPTEIFYIEINIPNGYGNLLYFDVFEENPYIPTTDITFTQLENYLESISQDAYRKRLDYLINRSLANKDFGKLGDYLSLLENLEGGSNAN